MTTELSTETLVEIINDCIINTTTTDVNSGTVTDPENVTAEWLEKTKHLKITKAGYIRMMPNDELLILIKENFAESFTAEQVARITGYKAKSVQAKFYQLTNSGNINPIGRKGNRKYKLVSTTIEAKGSDPKMETLQYIPPLNMVSNHGILQLIKKHNLTEFRPEDIVRITGYKIGSVAGRFVQLKKECKIIQERKGGPYRLVSSLISDIEEKITAEKLDIYKDLMNVLDKHTKSVSQLTDPVEMIKKLELIVKYKDAVSKAK